MMKKFVSEKKRTAALLACIIGLTLVAGCASGGSSKEASEPAVAAAEEQASEPEAAAADQASEPAAAAEEQAAEPEPELPPSESAPLHCKRREIRHERAQKQQHQQSAALQRIKHPARREQKQLLPPCREQKPARQHEGEKHKEFEGDKRHAVPPKRNYVQYSTVRRPDCQPKRGPAEARRAKKIAATWRRHLYQFPRGGGDSSVFPVHRRR